MERSFLPERSMNDLVMKAFQWGEANFGYFADNILKGGSAADTEHARKTETEKDLAEFKEGYSEYAEDRFRNTSIPFLMKGREVLAADGEKSSLLWAYGKAPLRFWSSMVIGSVANWSIPVFLRSPLYGAYSNFFGVNMDEAVESDFRFYPSFNAFFRRAIKADVRPISRFAELTSPADGKVLYFGTCENGFVEQVKGVKYSIRKFLGRPDVGAPLKNETEHQFCENLKQNPQNELYQIVVYLAPGDYHRFHSPCDFNITSRRHFPGDLFSVNPKIAAWVRDLFVLNERATFYGEWAHGFFSYCAVGATSVGSIIFHYDPELITNIQPGKVIHGSFIEKDFTTLDPSLKNGLPIEKGEMLGEFNLGSTIILIFEAPKNFEFRVEPGQKVQMGEPIGFITQPKSQS